MKHVSDGTANLLARLEALKPKFTEHLFRCNDCRDTGFILRTDDCGRTWGRRCQNCQPAPTPKIAPERKSWNQPRDDRDQD